MLNCIRNIQMSFVDIIIIGYPFLILVERELLPDIVNPLKENAFLYCIFFFTGGLLGGSFHFFTLKSNHRKTSEPNSLTLHIFTQVNIDKQNKKIMCLTFGVVFLSAFMNIAGNYIQNFIKHLIGDDTKTQGVFLFDALFIIFSCVALSIICLHIKLYRHHYVALVILFLGLIQFHTITNPLEGKIWLIIPITLAYSVVFGFISICIKYVMDKKYIAPFQFAFYYGLVGLILEALITAICLIFEIRNTYTDPIFNLPSSFISLFSSVSSAFLAIASLIINTLSFVGKIVILYYCNPISESVSYGLVNVFKWYYMFSRRKLTGPLEIIISITGSICYIIGKYMYFEYIRMKCFGLDIYTKKEITNRSLAETNDLYVCELEEIEAV